MAVYHNKKRYTKQMLISTTFTSHKLKFTAASVKINAIKTAKEMDFIMQEFWLGEGLLVKNFWQHHQKSIFFAFRRFIFLEAQFQNRFSNSCAFFNLSNPKTALILMYKNRYICLVLGTYNTFCLNYIYRSWFRQFVLHLIMLSQKRK